MTPEPDRLPRRGAVALDSRGVLGVITSADTEEVAYPDGSTGMAWTGVAIGGHFGHLWDSRYPRVVSYLRDDELATLEAAVWVVAKARDWRHVHDVSAGGRREAVSRMAFAVDALDCLEGLHGAPIGHQPGCCEPAVGYDPREVHADRLTRGFTEWGEG